MTLAGRADHSLDWARDNESGANLPADAAQWEAITAEQRVLHHARANARAKGKSRRYITENRLNLMFVLTRLGGAGLHGPEGRRQITSLMAALMPLVRTELWDGEKRPYWYSPELHPGGKRQSRETCPDPDGCGCGGHGWHVNLFVAGFLDLEALKELWLSLDPGNGYELRYRDWYRDNGAKGLRKIDQLRAGASYGCKYATKDWSDLQLEDGAHRYELAQGFQPDELSATVAGTRDDVETALATAWAGSGLTPVWCSDENPDWTGPPCWVYQWDPWRDG